MIAVVSARKFLAGFFIASLRLPAWFVFFGIGLALARVLIYAGATA